MMKLLISKYPVSKPENTIQMFVKGIGYVKYDLYFYLVTLDVAYIFIKSHLLHR